MQDISLAFLISRNLSSCWWFVWKEGFHLTFYPAYESVKENVWNQADNSQLKLPIKSVSKTLVYLWYYSWKHDFGQLQWKTAFFFRNPDSISLLSNFLLTFSQQYLLHYWDWPVVKKLCKEDIISTRCESVVAVQQPLIEIFTGNSFASLSTLYSNWPQLCKCENESCSYCSSKIMVSYLLRVLYLYAHLKNSEV